MVDACAADVTRVMLDRRMARRTIVRGGAVLPLAAMPARGGPRRAVAAATVPDWPVAFVRTCWATDPYALGSYSFLAPSEIGEEIRDLLARPVGERLHFAGEATSADFPATAHGALLSGRAVAARIIVDEDADMTVVVIGAGMAGLSCARALRDAGFAPVVVEARDRLGGRTWSARLGTFPADLGASWIHGVDGNPLTDLAVERGGALIPFDYDNSIGGDEDADAALAAMLEKAEEIDDPFTTPLAALFPNPLDDALLVAATQTIVLDYAADLDELAVAALEEGEEYGGGDALLRDGYSGIVAWLARGLDVRLGAEALVVRHGEAGCLVDLATGETIAADQVVVTVPAGVLKANRLAFHPPLPDWKRRAIDEIGAGLLDKLWLRFDEVFWDADVDLLAWSDPEQPGLWAAWVNGFKAWGEPALLGFNGGSIARELAGWSDEAVVESALGALRRRYG